MELNSHKVSAVSNPFFKLSLHVDIYISATIDNWIITFICKVGLSSWKKIFCFNESFLKVMKNAFHITLKDLFVLKIFKFLSWIFGRVEKQLD